MAEAESRHPNRRHILVGGATLSVMRGDVFAEAKQQHDAQATPEQNMMEIALVVNKTPYRLVLDIRTTLLDALREHIGLTGSKKGLRSRSMRGVHRARRRQARAVLSHARGCCPAPGDDDRRHCVGRQAASAAAGLHRVRRVPMWLLYAGTDHVGHRLRDGGTRRQRRRGARVYERQSLPLRRVSAYCRGDLAGQSFYRGGLSRASFRLSSRRRRQCAACLAAARDESRERRILGWRHYSTRPHEARRHAAAGGSGHQWVGAKLGRDRVARQ